MDDSRTYAVYFFPQALEALGDTIKPYLQEGAAGTHVLCREIDTGGPLIELTLDARTEAGDPLQVELMLPASMVRIIVSASGDEAFGFGPRITVPAEALPEVEPAMKAANSTPAAVASDGTG